MVKEEGIKDLLAWTVYGNHIPLRPSEIRGL